MDTLRSYFNKFKKFPSVSSSSGSMDLKSSEKLIRQGSLGRMTKTPRFRFSSEHKTHAQDENTTVNGKAKLFNTETEAVMLEKGRVSSLKRIYEKRDKPREKTPPPAKPPRKDQIFKVEFEKTNGQDLGIILDAGDIQELNGSVNTSDKNGFQRTESRLKSDSYVGCVKEGITLYRQNVNVVKVVLIKDGSLAQKNGLIQVNDEILAVNEWPLEKETINSARLLLANAVRSGKVVMTLRRRKKRPAPPPPDYPDDKNVSSHRSSTPTASSCLDNGTSCYSTPMSHSTDCIPQELSKVVYLNGHQGNIHSNNGSTYTLNSMCDSADEITGSMDDVFSEAVGDSIGTPKFQSKLSTNICDSKTINNGRCQADFVKTEPVEKFRTQSTSAIEDVLQWKTVNIDIASDEVDYVNTAEMARRRRGKGLSPLNKNSNFKSDISSYKSDPELVNIHRSYQKKSKKSMWRYNERSQTPTSCCSSRSDSGFSNSSPAKRVVSKMHLLKDENGLGIHIAGGKGSKKGDIGIFVAGTMETGAAYKDGRLKKGDELLMINGKSLIGLTHTEAVDVFRNSPKLVQLVVATKVRKAASIASSVSCSYSSLTPCPNSMLTTSQSFDATNCDQTDQFSCESNSSDKTVPELTAQTPHGTFIKWEELFEKFKTDGLCTDSSDKGDLLESKVIRTKKWRFDAPQTVTINKGSRGKGLGFTIVGGSDSEKGNIGIFVRRILPQGLMYEDGSIKEGDEILEVNGDSLSGLSHKDALGKFRKLKKGPVTLMYRHRIGSRPTSPSMRSGCVTPIDFSSDGSPVSTPGHSPYGSFSDLSKIDINQTGTSSAVSGHSDNSSGFLLRPPGHVDSYKCLGGNRNNNEDKKKDLHSNKNSETCTELDYVTLQKEYGIGLGVSLLRRDTNGVSHIYIQDIAQGSVADKDARLRKGDMIMEAEGRSLQDITLLDAYQVFRTLQPGPVTLVVKRGNKFKGNEEL
ncbi:tyrosine-protein phosphatase non-receptor type 13-like [Ylistrum balloti]|uniref:tyrosine-protein phosphatase non-receptor type 13-like n=1 Tax=Ylistrum balloti TaxID=509963 RepID=UPI002905A95C|nr:tyrosine-protein phosphatase non-receptor type 13-like [Ylistrum balloti]